MLVGLLRAYLHLLSMERSQPVQGHCADTEEGNEREKRHDGSLPQGASVGRQQEPEGLGPRRCSGEGKGMWLDWPEEPCQQGQLELGEGGGGRRIFRYLPFLSLSTREGLDSHSFLFGLTNLFNRFMFLEHGL